MNTLDALKAALVAGTSPQDGKFAELLADDMVFAGPVPQPIGKREFLALQIAMVKAMPDWNFNATDFKQDGDKVTCMFQITGTQTGELNLPMPGMPKIPPTGKRVSLPKEGMTFTFRDSKVTRIESQGLKNSGVAGVLAQLGVSMPQM